MTEEKLYYTDPLAAAYMAREFGVNIIDADGDSCNHESIDWAMFIAMDFDQLYIHPDSYHIFEPQVGDLVTHEYYCPECSESLTTWGEAFSQQLDSGEYKIIQRNNKPFFWPEGGV